MKLHFGHLTILLLFCDIGDSLERQLSKHSLLSFKYLSGYGGILGKILKNVLKKQHLIK